MQVCVYIHTHVYTIICIPYQVVLMIKNPPASAGDIKDAVLLPGPGKYLGGGHSNPFKYS